MADSLRTGVFGVDFQPEADKCGNEDTFESGRPGFRAHLHIYLKTGEPVYGSTITWNLNAL